MSKFFSPAKINLFFRVLEKRTDHYHEIASLYQAIDLGDLVHVSLAKEDAWLCSDPSVPPDLVFHAVSLFRKRTNLQFGVKVFVEKKIPVEMGLGGGSSNAATILWALNDLLNANLSLDQLISLAREIGSDVPFFFSQGSAYCTGRGDIFKNTQLPFSFSGWLACPSFGMKTVRVYQAVSEFSGIDPEKALKRCLQGNTIFFNDLERAAFSLEPRLFLLKKELEKRGYEKISMTGSGSSFFFFSKESPAPLKGVRFFSIRGIQRDPDFWFEAN